MFGWSKKWVEWKIKKRKVERKWLKWLFGWEESGERNLVGLGVFFSPTKIQSLQIVEIIGEKTLWMFWVFFILFVGAQYVSRCLCMILDPCKIRLFNLIN